MFFGRSSSEKSISASVFANINLNFSFISFTNLLNFPDKPEIAILLCFSVSELIRSASPSVCKRSNLSFINDLLENSPGSASLMPRISNIWEILVIIAMLPWQLISTISSPVKECGFLK